MRANASPTTPSTPAPCPSRPRCPRNTCRAPSPGAPWDGCFRWWSRCWSRPPPWPDAVPACWTAPPVGCAPCCRCPSSPRPGRRPRTRRAAPPPCARRWPGMAPSCWPTPCGFPIRWPGPCAASWRGRCRAGAGSPGCRATPTGSWACWRLRTWQTTTPCCTWPRRPGARPPPSSAPPSSPAWRCWRPCCARVPWPARNAHAGTPPRGRPPALKSPFPGGAVRPPRTTESPPP